MTANDGLLPINPTPIPEHTPLESKTKANVPYFDPSDCPHCDWTNHEHPVGESGGYSEELPLYYVVRCPRQGFFLLENLELITSPSEDAESDPPSVDGDGSNG